MDRESPLRTPFLTPCLPNFCRAAGENSIKQRFRENRNHKFGKRNERKERNAVGGWGRCRPEAYLIRESVSEIAYSEAKITRKKLWNSFLFQKNIRGTTKMQIRQHSIFRQLIKERTTMSIWILQRYLSRELRRVEIDFD